MHFTAPDFADYREDVRVTYLGEDQFAVICRDHEARNRLGRPSTGPLSSP